MLELARISFRRQLVDQVTRRVVGFGGAVIISTIALIFLYLLWVVAPIFKKPELEALPPIPAPEPGVLAFGASPSLEVMYFIGKESGLVFAEPGSGNVRTSHSLVGGGLTEARLVYPTQDTFALLDDHGALRFLRIEFRVRFDGDERRLEALGEPLFEAAEWHLGQVRDFDVYREADQLRLVSLAVDGTIQLREFLDVDDGFALRPGPSVSIEPDFRASRVRFGPRGQWIFAFGRDGRVNLFQASRLSSVTSVYSGSLLAEGERIFALEPLLGRHSWLLADQGGRVTQWTLGRANGEIAMHVLREFEFDAPVTHLRAEPQRKGFVAVDTDGGLHLVHTTSQRVLARTEAAFKGVRQIAFSPRADRLYALLGNGEIQGFAVRNEHPEISWSALWRKVWYEGYPEPSHTWQSSASQADFEPKFSLTPLLFGTLKAAFYAMLIAAPIAVMGAVYTAYFMAPRLRRWIKPGIEVMAALPTVVLGFVAGLWLAPLVETHLTATLLAFPLLPLCVLVVSFIFHLMPGRVTRGLDGWLGVLCLPLILLLIWLLFSSDAWLEAAIFGGSAQEWFRNELGLAYDQRNALIVGIAMGLAVIPIIFSISEDAIHGVPRHLTSGSLALGATPWQTLTRVVILTASPGIFSALMIGFGRAVGETMIVLMATGNTPILDMNLFEGMRTLAANIAVELPESEIGSSHYSILFLTALVLFAITFVFNTIAEIVRARLRERYAHL